MLLAWVTRKGTHLPGDAFRLYVELSNTLGGPGLLEVRQTALATYFGASASSVRRWLAVLAEEGLATPTATPGPTGGLVWRVHDPADVAAERGCPFGPPRQLALWCGSDDQNPHQGVDGSVDPFPYRVDGSTVPVPEPSTQQPTRGSTVPVPPSKTPGKQPPLLTQEQEQEGAAIPPALTSHQEQPQGAASDPPPGARTPFGELLVARAERSAAEQREAREEWLAGATADLMRWARQAERAAGVTGDDVFKPWTARQAAELWHDYLHRETAPLFDELRRELLRLADGDGFRRSPGAFIVDKCRRIAAAVGAKW